MKALTICQPYAHLITLPGSDPQRKRVENRTWPTDHRGPLLIHAGKSRKFMVPEDLVTFPTMEFGAIVAVARLTAVYGIDVIRLGRTSADHAWVADHPHTEGPYCWVLENVRRLAVPVPCRGAMGLFEPPPDVVAAVMGQIGGHS